MIELLVVIAIIAILAAMLLPTLAKAKAKAQTAQCHNNLRNLGQATHLYCLDFQDWIPRDTFGSYMFFANKFSPYVGGPQIPRSSEQDANYLYTVYDQMPIYHCPSVQQVKRPGVDIFVLHYTINSIDWVAYANEDLSGIEASKLTQARAPRYPVWPRSTYARTPLTPRGFGEWDIWNLTQTTFNNGTRIRAAVIHADDKRHQGNDRRFSRRTQ